VNRQRLFDLRVTFAATERLSLSGSLPWLAGTWSLPLPAGPAPGPRATQRAAGIGDLVLTPRFWLLEPCTNPDGNVQAGVGLKVPTGVPDLRDRFPDAAGGTRGRRRPVDPSLQPGDGGWGAVLEASAFRDVGKVRLFGSATYLVNPRETNRTLSPGAAMAGPAAVPAEVRRNSVADAYQAQAGVAVPLGGGFGASLALRVDGVPPRDLVGGNGGFRRPGYFTSLAPGLSWTSGRHSFAVSATRTIVANAQRDARGAPTDATFADYAVFLTWTWRF